VGSPRISRPACALACLLVAASVAAPDTLAQFRSPRQVASPRGAEGCRLKVRGMDFGGYPDGSPAGVLSTSLIELNCKDLTATPVVSAGPSATTGYYEDRQLANGESRLRYQVYINPQRTIVWGDGTGSTQPVSAVGTGNDRSFTVYGGILQGQSGVAGRYGDSFVVTVVP
jgi:spore coat protein U-like protein